MTFDELVGENVERLRGDMSQGALAKIMKELGHPWVQSTVSAIESGKRPLKLSEAESMSKALGVDLSELVVSSDAAAVQNATHGEIENLLEAFDEAVTAIDGLITARELYGSRLILLFKQRPFLLRQLDETLVKAHLDEYKHSTLANALSKGIGLSKPGRIPPKKRKLLEDNGLSIEFTENEDLNQISEDDWLTWFITSVRESENEQP